MRETSFQRGPATGRWPDDGELTAVRHGESLANVAFAASAATGAPLRGLGKRGDDVALSAVGRLQAAALGRWLAGQVRRPRLVCCSPYARARHTWELAARELPAGDVPATIIDDRLRDREMGEFELMPPAVIARRFPLQAQLREETGDLRYRPPGGESLLDVGERLRDFLAGVDLSDRPLVVAHDAVVLMLRQLIEPMPDEELLRVPIVANASITRWAVRDGSLRLICYNDTAHLTGIALPGS